MGEYVGAGRSQHLVKSPHPWRDFLRNLLASYLVVIEDDVWQVRWIMTMGAMNGLEEKFDWYSVRTVRYA